MNLTLDAGQRLFQQSLERWALDACDAPHRQHSSTDPHGWSPKAWKQMADLGLAGLCLDERHGGTGGGAVDVMLALQALGGSLRTEPLLTTLLCSHALALAGTPRQQDQWLPRMVGGDAVVAWAHGAGFATRTTAHRSADGWILQGAKSLVRHGASAAAFLVSAALPGDAGQGLFLVPAANPGLAVTACWTHDDLPAANLRLHDVAVSSDAALQFPAADSITAVERLGIVACTAESVGVMQTLLSLTLEHLRTRRQFGAALASFQVLQHRAVDMSVAVEQAASMALLASLSMQDGAHDLDRTLAQCKVQCNKSLRYVAQQAVQLHGAIGITQESRVGALFRRSTVLETEFGDTAFHLRALARAD